MPLARKTGRRADARQLHVLDELPASEKSLTSVEASLRYKAMKRSPTRLTSVSVFSAWGMISCQILLLRRAEVDGDHAHAAERSTSVLKNSRGPSLPRKVNSCSKLSISSKGMA